MHENPSAVKKVYCYFSSSFKTVITLSKYNNFLIYICSKKYIYVTPVFHWKCTMLTLFSDLLIVILLPQSLVITREAYSTSFLAVQLILTLSCVVLIKARRKDVLALCKLSMITSGGWACQLKATPSSGEEHFSTR